MSDNSFKVFIAACFYATVSSKDKCVLDFGIYSEEKWKLACVSIQHYFRGIQFTSQIISSGWTLLSNRISWWQFAFWVHYVPRVSSSFWICSLRIYHAKYSFRWWWKIGGRNDLLPSLKRTPVTQTKACSLRQGGYLNFAASLKNLSLHRHEKLETVISSAH